MAIVKRHWGKLCGLLTVLAIAALLAHLYDGLSAKADSGTPAPALASPLAPIPTPTTGPAGKDRVTAGGIRVLRQRLCLTNQDLAAMGCSKDAASALLNDLVSWYQSNKDALAQTQKSINTTSRDLQSAQLQMNVGSDDPQLPAKLLQLQKAHVLAWMDQVKLVQQCKEQIAAKLSDSQKAAWIAAQGNGSLPVQYRYIPGLKPDQRKALANASEAAARAAALGKGGSSGQSLTTVEGQILTDAQKSARDSAQAALAQNLAAVAQADKAVLETTAATAK